MAGILNFKKREERSIENPSTPLSTPSQWLVNIFGGGISTSGISVTREVAMRVPAFRASIRVLSDAIASLPLHVYDRTDNGAVRVTDEPIAKILHDAPNEETTSYEWRKWAMQETLIPGRSLNRIVRNGKGEVVAIYPLPTDKMSVGRDNNGKKIYKYDNKERFEASEILDIPFALGVDAVTHVNPLGELADTIGLAKALEEYGSRFFQNDARPGMVVELPVGLPVEAVKRAKEDLQKKTQGLGKAHSTLFFEGGIKLHQVGVENDHAQFLETRRMQIEEIARFYNIPPVFLQDLTRATFSNNEQQDLHWLKHSLRPWLVAWEQELNLKLFADKPGRYAQFNIDGVIRGDFNTRMAGLAKAIQSGLYTPNEARALQDLPPVDGGDQLYIQQNMSELDALNQGETEQ